MLLFALKKRALAIDALLRIPYLACVPSAPAYLDSDSHVDCYIYI